MVIGDVQIQIHAKIGEGTFGDIVLSEKENEEGSGPCYFAMKIIEKCKLLKWKILHEAENERRALEVISPFCIELYFTYESPTHVFIGMEYCPGGDLYQLLVTKGTLDLEQAVIYTAEITSALITLHEQNVIYRDLKPENVVITSLGHIKLVDFGMAYSFSESELIDGIVTESGTLLYSPPEFLLRLKHKKECDWWNVGIILYEMLTGDTPFESASQEDTIRNICSPERQARMPESLRSTDAAVLIQQFLQVEQAQRLGYEDNHKEIKGHPFFSNVDWERLLKKEYALEYIPGLSGPLDTSNFDCESFQKDLRSLIEELRRVNEKAIRLSRISPANTNSTEESSCIPSSLNGFSKVEAVVVGSNGLHFIPR